MREIKVENRLKQRTEAAGGMCIKLVVLALGGLPDRLVLLPKGKIMFVELKAPAKGPTPLQVYMHGKIRALGFEVHVVNTLEGVDALFT
jgi:hypothetical protein